VQREAYIFFKNLYEFNVLELKDTNERIYHKMMESSITMNYFWDIWKNNCSNIWVRSGLMYSKQLLMRRLISLSLCPCKGMPVLLTSVVKDDAKCLLLAFSRW